MRADGWLYVEKAVWTTELRSSLPFHLGMSGSRVHVQLSLHERQSRWRSDRREERSSKRVLRRAPLARALAGRERYPPKLQQLINSFSAVSLARRCPRTYNKIRLGSGSHAAI